MDPNCITKNFKITYFATLYNRPDIRPNNATMVYNLRRYTYLNNWHIHEIINYCQAFKNEFKAA